MAKKQGSYQQQLEAWLERDLTAAALADELPPAFEQEEAIGRLSQILLAGRCPVVTGDRGVGKTAILYELVRRAARGEGPVTLRGQRVLQFSLRRRASGLKRPRQIGARLAELVEALVEIGADVVPYFRDFHLAWTFDLESQFEALAYRFPNPVLCEGDHGTIESMFEHSPELEQHYVVLRLKEPDLDHARRILQEWSESVAAGEGEAGRGKAHSRTGERARASAGPRFEAPALEMALQLSHRFLARSHLPRKALEPLRQLATLQRAPASEGPPESIGEAQIIDRFCESYQLPRFLVDPAVTLDLDDVEAHFRSRLLGQEEAVSAVVDMIGLIKAGLSDPRRPFGVFLFVGPTGVGKTHLAQLLAEYLFGTPDRMIRFNMADHAEERSSLTLFGDPDDSRRSIMRGVLTQRIMGHPFAVLLLDEFEKAAEKVHDRFLQLFDEGCFINGAGESVSCRSFIIIATSNAGAELWRGGLMGFAGTGDRERLQRELGRRLREQSRFEFLNRFDRVVQFRPLDRQAIRTIALRELEQLKGRSGLQQRGIDLELDEGLLDWLVVHGYDPHYGARFLRRTIERHVSTALAALLVRESPPSGARIALAVRRARVRARVVTTPGAPQKREAVTLPMGTTERVRSLDRERLLEEVDSVLRAAADRLADLDRKREEYRALLERINQPSFWDDAEAGEEILERFRELDVAIQVEGRLARPLEHLSALRGGEGREPATLDRMARALEAAAGVLHEWDERTAEEGASAVWLLISRLDPLQAAGSWIADLAQMERRWCRQLGLHAAVVAYSVAATHLARVALEVEGLGAEVCLAMEAGIHRLARSQGGDLRARIEVLRRSDAPAMKVEVAQHAPKPGLFELEIAATAELEREELGQVLSFEGVDASLLGHLLADFQVVRRGRPEEPPAVARIYGEDGIGARDPRTGAVVPRFKKVMRGHLDRLLEGWRRLPG